MTVISSKPKPIGKRPRRSEFNNKRERPSKPRRSKRKGARRKLSQFDTSVN